MTARIIGSAIGLAVILSGAAAPALAQLVPNYPVIIVPPPPAQNYVAPKPDSKTVAKPKSPADEPASSDGQSYHGRTQNLNRY